MGAGWVVPRAEPAHASELSGSLKTCMAMTPNPDFEHFVRDYIRLAGQERSPELRSRLLVLAREWMQAAMHEEAGKRDTSTIARLKMR